MSEQIQTIHVVDDDEAMRDSMTWLLEGEGYRVACFDSAEAFAKAAAAHGEEIFGDIPNFTNTQPAVQINDFAEPAQGR